MNTVLMRLMFGYLIYALFDDILLGLYWGLMHVQYINLNVTRCN